MPKGVRFDRTPNFLFYRAVCLLNPDFGTLLSIQFVGIHQIGKKLK